LFFTFLRAEVDASSHDEEEEEEELSDWMSQL
jgi:hypothetical protein